MWGVWLKTDDFVWAAGRCARWSGDNCMFTKILGRQSALYLSLRYMFWEGIALLFQSAILKSSTAYPGRKETLETSLKCNTITNCLRIELHTATMLIFANRAIWRKKTSSFKVYIMKSLLNVWIPFEATDQGCSTDCRSNSGVSEASLAAVKRRICGNSSAMASSSLALNIYIGKGKLN